MHGYGATLVGDEPVRLDAPEHVRALGFVKRLQDDGLLPQRPTSQLVSSLYEAEKAAFVISGPWFVGSVTRPLVAAPLPIVSETGEPARPYLTVEGVFLADQAANASDARAFARFLSEEGAQARQDVGGQAVSLEGVTTDDPILRVQHQQAAVAIPMPTDPNVQSIWEAQARSLRRVLRGAATPEEAGVGAQEYMQALSRPPPQEAAMWPYALLLALLGAGALALFGNQVRKVEVRYAVASHWRDYLWVGPATVAMAVLVVLPFVTGAGVAFYAHHQGEWTFVGVQHFIDILTSRDWPVTSPMSFFYTLGVTILWTITNVFLHVSIGVALALILREPWIRLRGVWRALLILPWAVPNYITALIWKTMFDAQYGAINSILTLALFQSEPIELDWFGSFSTAFTANLVTNTWLGFPFMMVVTLGALQAIPRDLEEAAEVDGAGPVARFRHVTWPLLRPALMPAVVLGSIWTFNMFNIVYLVSGGEPDGATEILISEAYRWAFSRGNQYGYAAAYAVIIFGVLLVYSRGANRLAGRRVV